MSSQIRTELAGYRIGDVVIFAGYVCPGGQNPVFSPGQHIRVEEISEVEDALVCFPVDPDNDEFGDMVFLDEITGKAIHR